MKRYIYPVASLVVLAVIALCFFAPAVFQGEVLQQHDIMQGISNGQEVKAFEAATGETSRWTNSLFGGMPNFQIAPSYESNKLLGWVQAVYGLGLPSPANLLFMLMAGFFIMCLCMKMRWYTALFASIAWGFSTYFIIIIGAGHIWKFLALCYIPPTIGGLALLYRGKYLGGAALTSLAASMQLMSNHPQMSYYFLLVIACLVIAWGVVCWRDRDMKRWGIATATAAGCACLALAVNCASLYNSYEYSKETVRGRSTLLTGGEAAGESLPSAGGMDHEAITAWSYGLDETWSLLIPNVKGGATIKPVGGQNQLLSLADTDTADGASLSSGELQFLSQFPQYFGDQPMTNGPVYVGAVVLLLAILALFVVDGPVYGPIKWALFAASVLAIALSWGHNFAPLTDFMIDHFPGYNKFRAVASILVVPEFCIPLLAALSVKKMIDTPDFYKRYQWTLFSVFGLGALVCLVGWLAPGVFGSPFSVSESRQLSEMGVLNDPMYSNIFATVRKARLDMVSADSIRSFLFIALGFGVIMLWLKGAFRVRPLFVGCLTAVVLIDLFTVNRRYVDADNFVEPVVQSETLEPTAADRTILADPDPNYRVADLDDFGGARSSYFHKTIGGYHAAKLTRYNDLLANAIQPALPESVEAAVSVLGPEGEAGTTGAEESGQGMEAVSAGHRANIVDALNTRYFILQSQAIPNPNALGNAWFVDRVEYVGDTNAEMAGVKTADLSRVAVANESAKRILGEAQPSSAGDRITETSYRPNRLTYKATSAAGGVAVFSEVWFPWGWEAAVNGEPVEIACVDYALRAIRIPAGESEIEMTFEPRSLAVTNGIGVAACIVLFLLMLGAIVKFGLSFRRK